MPAEMSDHLSPPMMDVKDDSSDWQTSDEDQRGNPKTRSTVVRGKPKMPTARTWCDKGKQVMIIRRNEGPFTVEARHADIPNLQWKYDLIDANGNKRTGVLESKLKQCDESGQGS